MEKITHSNLNVNGISMHVAEIGEAQAPAVLFLHGFPELWYSWRHQMLFLSSKGYRSIAPDLRGYGDTDAPPSATDYTVFHIVGDLVALLDALGLDQVFLVGHDWGAAIAWYICLFRPDRIKALVNTSVAWFPRHPTKSVLGIFRDAYGDDHYINRFQEPGVMEKEYAQAKTDKLVKAIIAGFVSCASRIPKEPGFGKMAEAALITPPSWLTEEDINYYATKFDRTGFTGGLNYYRALDLNWELTAPWNGAKIPVPTKFIVGDLDLTYHVPGMKDFIHNGEFKEHVPNLKEVVVMEGVAHFVNQDKAEEINLHIYDFIRKF